MSDTNAIVQDEGAGLFGFRLEMGRGYDGARMPVRRSGFATEKTALTEYRRSSARMVERAYQQLETDGYSRTTLRTLNLVLRKAFGEQTGRNLGLRKPLESDEERQVWTLAEARRFAEHVHEDRLYPMWRLLLATGLRRGELCGLRCGDLELGQGTLTERRQIVVEDPGSRLRVKPPKSYNGLRVLKLDPITTEQLADRAAGQGTRYLFTGRTDEPMRPDSLTDRFNDPAIAAGVRPLGPHQVRHLIASNLLDAGYGIHEVAERLGNDAATLMRYYAQVGAAQRLQAGPGASGVRSQQRDWRPFMLTGGTSERVTLLILRSPG
ncbi:site-specific integrase [Actinoplanes sp. NPDC023936]|uniref:tyrosine-type recombinase/integrase n=1 Tax=Actinoplanes sp. NPDC023936 TaxID=3154910 RepID=UPI00340DCB35